MPDNNAKFYIRLGGNISTLTVSQLGARCQNTKRTYNKTLKYNL